MSRPSSIQVLDDYGYLRYVDHLGSDNRVCEVARLSFDKWDESCEEYLKSNKPAKLIKYLASHNHWCYDDQTEIFTEDGWVAFSDLRSTQKVAQVNPKTFEQEFVVPEKLHCCPYSGPMYLAESNTVNYCVTPGHKMLYQTRTSTGYSEFKETTSDQAVKYKHKRFRNTASMRTRGGKGTFSEGWILGFVLGDGFVVQKNVVCVRLKRDRKIQALSHYLAEAYKEYSLVVTKDDVTQITFELDTNLVGTVGTKKTPPLSGLSSDYIQGMFEGLMEANGSVKHSRGWAFSSSSRELFEGAGTLATACGYWMTEGTPRHTENPNHQTNYRGVIRSREYGNVTDSHESVIDYTGNVYCVTVPTGYVLVRRHGKQVVCGNTPFGHPQITVEICMPIFVARQWMKSNVGIVYNEVSRRYVDSEPEFYYPLVWRGRPDGSIKQGSGAAVDNSRDCERDYFFAVQKCVETYNLMLKEGVAPEMARMILPQSMYTRVAMTASLAACARIVGLRNKPDAQWEIQQYGKALYDIVQPLFPLSMEALSGE
jgi:thymidylate synthase (FAD)